jgi:hypothetical protein
MITPKELVGLLPPTFAPDYVDGAAVPYLLTSRYVEERPVLPLWSSLTHSLAGLIASASVSRLLAQRANHRISGNLLFRTDAGLYLRVRPE